MQIKKKELDINYTLAKTEIDKYKKKVEVLLKEKTAFDANYNSTKRESKKYQNFYHKLEIIFILFFFSFYLLFIIFLFCISLKACKSLRNRQKKKKIFKNMLDEYKEKLNSS